MREEPSRGRVRRGLDVRDRPLGDHASAAHARARADVDHVVGAAYRLLVVLDDEKRVALARERADGLEQHRVVARVQSDRRLVEHVAGAPQVRAELACEMDALRFAPGERRGAPVEREVVKSHLGEEPEARADLREGVVRDGGASRVKVRRNPPEPGLRLPGRHGADFLDGQALPENASRDLVQAGAAARRADDLRLIPGAGELLVLGLGLAHGLADRGREHAVARADRAGAHVGVVGEEPRVGLGEASSALRAGAGR